MRPQAKEVLLIGTFKNWEGSEVENIQLILVFTRGSPVEKAVEEAFSVNIIHWNRSIALRSIYPYERRRHPGPAYSQSTGLMLR